MDMRRMETHARAPKGGGWCFFSSRRRHTRYIGDWSSDVCSSDLPSVVKGGLTYDVAKLRPAVVTTDFQRNDAFWLHSDQRVAHLPGITTGLTSSRSVAEIGRASCRERVWISAGAGP